MTDPPTPCPKCGSLVLPDNANDHDDWHAQLNKLLDMLVDAVATDDP